MAPEGGLPGAGTGVGLRLGDRRGLEGFPVNRSTDMSVAPVDRADYSIGLSEQGFPVIFRFPSTGGSP